MTLMGSILKCVKISTALNRSICMPGVGGKGAIPLIHWLLIQRPGTELSPCSGDVFSLVSNWYHLLSEWHHRSHGRGDGDQMVKRWWQATSERTSLHFQFMWFSFGPSLILSIRSSGFLPSLLSLSEYFFYCLCVPIQLPNRLRSLQLTHPAWWLWLIYRISWPFIG